MPLFSIITPVYNNKKYLQCCVNSVLSQDFDDYEYIIVDDGSTDGTSELCDEIARKNSRIRVIHQSNQWIYASFNNGIAIAKGEYVFILNSDDSLKNGSLSKLYNIISKYEDLDVVWTQVNVYRCDEHQNALSEPKVVGYAGCEYPNDLLLANRNSLHEFWKELYYYGYTVNQANLYKRCLMVSHPFRNDYYGADSLFNISIADDINSSYVLAEPIYNFFEYENKNMNASCGKVYGYEFEMFREIFNGHARLISKWNGSKEDICYFKELELQVGFNCLNILKINNKYSSEEKMGVILDKYYTEEYMNELAPLETFCVIDSVVTKELLMYVYAGDISSNSKYFFVKEFFNEIGKENKEDIDVNIIYSMLTNSLNPCHYGISICSELGLIDL